MADTGTDRPGPILGLARRGLPPLTGLSLRRACAPLAAGTLGTALFLALFGYWGLVHDARLYALQALAWLYPQLRQDLYLRFGSQDDYTLFSALFTPLIQVLGLDGAALVLNLLSLLALFAATAYLLARLIEPAGHPPGDNSWDTLTSGSASGSASGLARTGVRAAVGSEASHLNATLVGRSGGPYAASLAGSLVNRSAGPYAAILAGTLAVAMLPVAYGAMAIFHVAEPFATPRPLAAALGLLTVAWALERRWRPAALAAVAALMVHPLMSWPAVVLALWVGLRPRQAVTLTLLGALSLILAAWTGAPVLGRLFQVMDPEWKAMTSALAPFLWTATWQTGDWNTAGVALLSPLVAAAALAGAGAGQGSGQIPFAGEGQGEGGCPSPRHNDLGGFELSLVSNAGNAVYGCTSYDSAGYIKPALAASLLGATGLVAAALLGDGFDNLLSLQLQPWRAHWLSHWLGVAGLGLLGARYAQSRDPADLIACLGLAGAELLIASSGVLILIFTLAARQLYRRHLSPTANRLLLMMMAAIFALGLALNLLGLGMHSALRGLLLQPAAVAMLLVTAGWLVARYVKTPRLRRVAQVAGLGLIGVLVMAGVQRSLVLAQDSGGRILIDGASKSGCDRGCDRGRDNGYDCGSGSGSDSKGGIPSIIPADFLPPQGSILWEGTPLSLWYQWHYPSYLHTLQLAGSVFSREKLMAAKKRIAHLEAILGPLDLINRESVSLDLPPPDPDQIERLCADPHLAGIFYADKRELPGPADGAGAMGGAEVGAGAKAGAGAEARAGAADGGVFTLRNPNGDKIGILALCPGGIID